jgi:hypothetical protein
LKIQNVKGDQVGLKISIGEGQVMRIYLKCYESYLYEVGGWVSSRKNQKEARILKYGTSIASKKRGVSINWILISFLLFLFNVGGCGGGGVQEGSEQMKNTYMKLFMVKKWTSYLD